MTEKKKEPIKLREVLEELYQGDLAKLSYDQRGSELTTLENYINGNGVRDWLFIFYEDRAKTFPEGQLSESETKKLKRLQMIKVVDFIPDTNVSDGVQKYSWGFTGRYDTSQLKESSGHEGPLQKIYDYLNEESIHDPAFAMRIMMIKGRVAKLGDLSGEQREQLTDLAIAVFRLAQTGKDGYGKLIEANYIIPFFEAGLKTIGINSKEVNDDGARIVYAPQTPIKPVTAESLSEQWKRIENEMAIRSAPTNVKKTRPVTTSKETPSIGKIVDEESLTDILTARVTRRYPPREKIERPPYEGKIEKVHPLKPTIVKTKIEGQTVYLKRKEKLPEESLKKTEEVKPPSSEFGVIPSSYDRLYVPPEEMRRANEEMFRKLKEKPKTN